SQGFCFFTSMVHIVPHATDLGFSATTAANILATVGGAGIVGRVVMGNVADRIGNRLTYIVCFLFISLTYLWLVFAKELWMLYLFAIIFGFAIGGTGVLGSPLTAKLFGLRSHGLILGFVNLGVTGGGALGPIFAGYIFDSTNSYEISFLASAAVAFVGIILAVLIRPTLGEG
ncbi:MFS transporter, partial [Chloroflexota bacterium]